MENDETIYNLLFDSKMTEGLFSMNDDELLLQKEKFKDSEEKLEEYINSNFDLTTKEKLKSLIEEKEDNYNDCVYSENRLFYKNGIKDGISMILNAITKK